jgi:CMP-2-keto-3-deoxyoctulosonic acid synthetase
VKWKPTPLERGESLEQLRPLENGVRVHVLVTKHGSPGIDTPEDAENMAASLGRGVYLTPTGSTATQRRGRKSRKVLP